MPRRKLSLTVLPVAHKRQIEYINGYKDAVRRKQPITALLRSRRKRIALQLILDLLIRMMMPLKKSVAYKALQES